MAPPQLSVLFSLALLGVACRGGCGQGHEAIPPSAQDSASVRAPDGASANDTGAPTVRVDTGEEAADEVADELAAASLEFEFDPPVLRVYRDTRVALRVVRMPADVDEASFRWIFEDGTPPATGDEVEHVFAGGLRDQRVTLEASRPDDKVVRVQRVVPLERLPPRTRAADDQPAEREPPPPALEGPGALRAVAVSGWQIGDDAADIARRLLALSPRIIVLLGDHVPKGGANASRRDWAPLEAALLEPARRAGVAVLPVLGEADLDGEARIHAIAFWQQHRPATPLLVGSSFPEAWALRAEGVLFAAVHTEHADPDAEILRLQAVLGRGAAGSAKVVLSHFPPAPFTEVDRGSLPRAYRFYEIFQRHGVDALVTGHYAATYLGLYGALKVASAGRINTPCDALPDGTCTPPAVVVLDFVDGSLEKLFAVDFSEPVALLPLGSLPSVALGYRRLPSP